VANEDYPKSQRFLPGARTLDLCYELLSSTVESIYVQKVNRKQILSRMSLIFEKKRVLLRLAMDLKYLSFPQFEFASKSFLEIGRMIGGWLKSLA
jgi:hypothetical protein